MKLSKKFFKDLHKIGEDAFIEKNQWVGKLVPDIVVDNLKKRGITPDDLEGCVVLTVEEANRIIDSLHRAIKAHIEVSRLTNGWTELSIEENDIYMLKERIEQAEKQDANH